MTDTRQAALAAIFGRLQGAVGAPVFSQIPDDTPPPAVIIDQISQEPVGDKDGGLDRVSFEIVTVTAGKSRTALFTIMAAVRERLENITLVQAGFFLSPAIFEGSDEQTIEDGQAMVGRQRFAAFIQPA